MRRAGGKTRERAVKKAKRRSLGEGMGEKKSEKGMKEQVMKVFNTLFSFILISLLLLFVWIDIYYSCWIFISNCVQYICIFI